MSIINVLIRLLTVAYTREAEALERKGEKLKIKATKTGKRAEGLAKEAREELEVAQEQQAQSTTHYADASRLRNRGDEVVKFFSREDK